MKYFVVSDVHSFASEMLTALNKAGFDIENPEHIFISCGDLFDRGEEAKRCLDFVLSIPKERRIFILGNHEIMLKNILQRKNFNPYDEINGTLSTVRQLSGVSCFDSDVFEKLSENKKLQTYIRELKNYYEIDKYIFVHAWIPCNKALSDWRSASELEWKDATWPNGYDLWAKGNIVKGKTIVCGHWHTSYAHHKYHHYKKEFPDSNESIDVCCFDPFYDEGIIGIDACTALTHKVNCLVI